MKDLKVVFMGTPTFASNILEEVIKVCNVVLVTCQPDRNKDKKGNVIMPSTKEVAIKNNIDVFQPLKVREDFDYILKYEPDIIITCAYGQIIPKELLEYPKYGCINVHASLLPKYRGGAPIHQAIIDGEDETGITIMYMNEKMDEGNIISQRSLSILDSDNLETMFDKLSVVGKDLLLDTLPSIINNTNDSIKQDDSLATYAYNIKKDKEKINFNNNVDVFNLVRGLYLNPGAYFILDNKRVKVFNSRISSVVDESVCNSISNIYEDGFSITCCDNSQIIITEIAIEGKKRMLVSDYLKGVKKDSLLGKIVNEEV